MLIKQIIVCLRILPFQIEKGCGMRGRVLRFFCPIVLRQHFIRMLFFFAQQHSPTLYKTVNRMGGLITRALSSLVGIKEKKILMLGLDAAGKTTVLNKLQTGETVTTIPTIGFNVEELQYKNVSFTVWDIGGQEKIRRLWRYYYEGVDALIFVVDSNDRARIEEAGDELRTLLQENLLSNATLLVYANKQDLPHSMATNDIIGKLKLTSFHHRQWYVQGTCATSGDGLYEGLDWLSTVLKKK